MCAVNKTLLNYDEDTGLYLWNKTFDLKLSPHFTSSEFACHCKHAECREQKIAVDLIEKLEQVRVEFGAPIFITSGYRCGLHQADLRKQGYETAAGISTHEQGRAADIRARQLTPLYPITEKYFKAVGQARTFLHVDLRDDKTRRWTYK